MRKRQILLGAGVVALLGLVTVSSWVQYPAPYELQALGGGARGRTLVLYHPSRDTGFADALARAFGEGLRKAGYAVDLATLADQTISEPNGYDLVGVVSNTFYWAPDGPTQRYLKRAQLRGIAVVGLMAGAGSTERSERMLGERLRVAGGRVAALRSFWLLRPNDESRRDESNRWVALELARDLGRSSGEKLAAASAGTRSVTSE